MIAGRGTRLAVTALVITMSLSGCIGPGGEPTTDGGAGTADTGSGGFSDTHVFPGNYTTEGPISRPLDPGPHEPLDPLFMELESPVDGGTIALEVHRPAVRQDEKTPVILDASPYYDTNWGSPNDTYASEGLYSQALVANFVPHGYAVALLAVRGTADSDGCWDVLGPKGTQDIDHAIDWLANQNWSSESVGVIGLSQDGAAAFQAAASGNEHVETIVPVAGWPDHYGRLLHNGTWMPRTAYAVTRPAIDAQVRQEPETTRPSLETRLSRARCPEMVEAVGALAHGKTLGAGDPVEYWAARDIRDEIVHTYNGSIFLVHGLSDDVVRAYNTQPWVSTLPDRGIPVKQTLGQWGHAMPDHEDAGAENRRWDFAESLLHWFDYWLEGGRSTDLGPKVQVQDGTGQWRSASAWPPEAANETVLHLQPDLTLSRNETTNQGSVLVGLDHDEISGVDVSECRMCVRFATTPMQQTLRFAGFPNPHLTVTPTGPGGYLTADLYLVSPEGNWSEVADGQMDLRFADGGRTADEVVPGQPLVARMELGAVDAIVPEGWRLGLEISQGSAGDGSARSAVMGGSVTGELVDVPPTPVRLELGGGQSTLTLETFDVDKDAFFDPP